MPSDRMRRSHLLPTQFQTLSKRDKIYRPLNLVRGIACTNKHAMLKSPDHGKLEAKRFFIKLIETLKVTPNGK